MSGFPGTSTPVVSIVTAHGRQALAVEPGERLIDCLNRNRVPWSAVSIYVVPRDGGEPTISACLDTVLSDYHEASEILLYFNRNVNPFKFMIDDLTTVPVVSGGAEATEYVYQRMDNDRGTSDAFLKKLSPQECQEVIAARVRDTIAASVEPGSRIVVGVSGGGDSNAMLYGLSQLRDLDIEIDPIILMGIPDWDAGVPRAKELCARYELDLTVVDENSVKELLGIPADSSSLIERFEREFPGDDFEFMGTLLIRLALIRRAKEVGTSYICTGLNLEDVLCEALFRTASGLKPNAAPARPIGDVTLLFPLWLCPKRIIDGCFPKYSLDNYDARYPCFSLGRNLYYSMVYTLQSQYPGAVETLTKGLAEIGTREPAEYTYHESLGFHVERDVPLPLLRKFQRMLGRSTVLS